jgi:aconitate hydratase
MNLTQKIISKHLPPSLKLRRTRVSTLNQWNIKPGEEISLVIDQTLTQDATGTLAYLQFEAMGVPKVKTKLSVSYVDHNTLQTGFESADDHKFLMTFAQKYGIVFSPAGTGICHQVHLENFGKPGLTLIGSDSHTPTAGALGMLAFGAGGLDVACAMAGEPFYLSMPRVVRVTLTGKLRPWVSAKDIILELLRRLTVKGGVGRVFEFAGPGVKTLSVPERATITNMGAELGASTSVFPSDEITKDFLNKHSRVKDWKPLTADKGAIYDEEIEISLADLEPLIALPHSPDNVKKVSDLKGTIVDQVAIGSCTNSSLSDLMLVAKVLKGKKIDPNVSLVISPGSKQVLLMLSESGALMDIIASGARVLECACGPCIGMGQAPVSGAVSLRTFNRNFEGRSGTRDADVYLVSPEVAVASALRGVITDPTKYFKAEPTINLPKKFLVDRGSFIYPSKKPAGITVLRGPNIKPLPEFDPLFDKIEKPVLIKLGDNISTDHILPAGAKILPLRSNLEKISEFAFSAVDNNFVKRAKSLGGGIIVAGENYGQGSSREHAALAPRYLGVKAVLAKSFARIHLANMINFGLLPFVFKDPKDYDHLNEGDAILLDGLITTLKSGNDVTAAVVGTGRKIVLTYNLTSRQKEILFAGGLLNYIKEGTRLSNKR